MSNRYPCPNPTCTYEFDAAQLAGAASVPCPKCGIVIQLRAQPATVPMARPVAPAPLARPAAPPPAARSAPPIVRPRSAPAGRDWLTYVALIGGFLVLLGAGVGAIINQLRGPTGGT